MVALFSLLTIIVLSITVVRIGAIALELTGLSHEIASFQAQSAFSGAGFTTSESESVVNHPVRRKIIRILVLVGGAGITSTIATFILTLIGPSEETLAYRLIVLSIGLVGIFFFAKSQFIYRLTKKIIVQALSRSTNLMIYDYQELLGISRGYSISRITMNADNWAVGKKLKNLNLNQEGTLILSIHRRVGDKERFMIPSGETTVQPGDKITVYGNTESCQCLADRKRGKEGDEAHKLRIEQEKKRAEIREITEGFVEV